MKFLIIKALIIKKRMYEIFIALLMWLLDKYKPLYEFSHSLLDWLFYPLLGLGLSIDLWSVTLFLLSKTTINPMKPSNSSKLVVKGMYRLSRNPMYLGLLLILSAWAICLKSISSFLLLPIFVVIINRQQIFKEEAELERIFCQSYLDYKNKVRRWL